MADLSDSSATWTAAPAFPQEAARLEEVLTRRLLEISDVRLHDYTHLCATIFSAPIAHVGILDSDRNWVKAPVGLDLLYCNRDESFCAHAILEDDMLIVNDTYEDTRFATHPFTRGEPHIRFYAGAVVRSPDSGLPLGTLCVIDHEPRAFSAQDRIILGHVRDLLQKEMIDYSNREADVEAVVRRALTDDATGLPGSRLMVEYLDESIRVAMADHAPLAVLGIEIARFDDVVRARGKALAQPVLRAVAERLRAALPESCSLGRWRDERFVVVASRFSSSADLAELSRSIHDAFSESIEVDGEPLRVSIRVGGSQYPEDGAAADELIDAAWESLTQLGTERSGFVLHNPEVNARVRQEFELEQSLRRALDESELHLVYQPKVTVLGESTVGVEALMRWNSPVLGSVPPQRFIRVAERSDLIHLLGTFALERACEEALGWETADLTVAVNVSALELQDPAYAKNVEGILTRTGLPPALLTLELTESAFLGDSRNAYVNIHNLAALGIAISIDDFGTGYSSFAQLRDLPIHQIKIDKIFVDHLTTDDRHASVCQPSSQWGVPSTSPWSRRE